MERNNIERDSQNTGISPLEIRSSNHTSLLSSVQNTVRKVLSRGGSVQIETMSTGVEPRHISESAIRSVNGKSRQRSMT